MSQFSGLGGALTAKAEGDGNSRSILCVFQNTGAQTPPWSSSISFHNEWTLEKVGPQALQSVSLVGHFLSDPEGALLSALASSPPRGGLPGPSAGGGAAAGPRVWLTGSDLQGLVGQGARGTHPPAVPGPQQR